MTVYLWFSDPPGSGIGRYASILLDAVEEAVPLHYIPSRGKYMESYNREERMYLGNVLINDTLFNFASR